MKLIKTPQAQHVFAFRVFFISAKSPQRKGETEKCIRKHTRMLFECAPLTFRMMTEAENVSHIDDTNNNKIIRIMNFDLGTTSFSQSTISTERARLSRAPTRKKKPANIAFFGSTRSLLVCASQKKNPSRCFSSFSFSPRSLWWKFGF